MLQKLSLLMGDKDRLADEEGYSALEEELGSQINPKTQIGFQQTVLL